MQQDPRKISISDYSYVLPEERIALYPLPERDASRLLLYRDGQISDRYFKYLPELLPPDSLLLLNNTKVIRARLLFENSNGAKIEVFCLQPISMETGRSQWLAMVGNAKRWKSGRLEKTYTANQKKNSLFVEITDRKEDYFHLAFQWTDESLNFWEVLDNAGLLPLPPYMHRDAEDSDLERYQTTYAQHSGSVAAPTAGLHFTENTFRQLAEKNIRQSEITLHVGAGTFKPVKAASMEAHVMHHESVYISRESIELMLQYLPGHITMIGTTTVRSLESLYHFAMQLRRNMNLELMQVSQWEAYSHTDELSPAQALELILEWMHKKGKNAVQGETQLMIAPAYRFRFCNALVTNFHQPQSTLLLLVAALTGQDWKRIYEHALAGDYRFLSYGDSSLLYRY